MEKKIIIQPEVSFLATEYKINSFTDNGKLVDVDLTLIGQGKQQNMIITIWDGQDYINAGQYTDMDIQNRLNELL